MTVVPESRENRIEFFPQLFPQLTYSFLRSPEKAQSTMFHRGWEAYTLFRPSRGLLSHKFSQFSLDEAHVYNASVFAMATQREY